MRQCTKARGQLSQCDHDSGKVDGGFVAQVSFVVSRIHRSKIFDFAKVIFDEMTPPIFDPIMGDRLFPVRF